MACTPARWIPPTDSAPFFYLTGSRARFHNETHPKQQEAGIPWHCKDRF
jgi:hypothetical protein